MTRSGRARRLAPPVLAGIFAVSGVLHFVAPGPYASIVPRWLPAPRGLVYGSGVLELVCAVGLQRRAAWAAPASFLLLLAVFPANVQMAVDAGSGRHPGLADSPVLAWGRLPLQLPMLWAAWVAREDGGPGS